MCHIIIDHHVTVKSLIRCWHYSDSTRTKVGVGVIFVGCLFSFILNFQVRGEGVGDLILETDLDLEGVPYFFVDIIIFR
jgi:hypothetical protein